MKSAGACVRQGESILSPSLKQQPSLMVRGRKAFYKLIDDSISIIFPSSKATRQNEQQQQKEVVIEGDEEVSTTAYWVEAVIVLLGAAVGFVECFFGYRIFKLMVSVIGFLAGAFITYFMVYFTCESFWGAHWYVTVISVVVAVIAGAICAWAAWYFYLLTVFCTGTKEKNSNNNSKISHLDITIVSVAIVQSAEKFTNRLYVFVWFIYF